MALNKTQKATLKKKNIETLRKALQAHEKLPEKKINHGTSAFLFGMIKGIKTLLWC